MEISPLIKKKSTYLQDCFRYGHKQSNGKEGVKCFALIE